MSFKKMTPLLFCLIAFTLSQSTAAHADEKTIRIYAASSLTNVLNQLINQYENDHAVDIVPIYGGSSSLARQIEHGAPADLFISANEQWVDYLEQQGTADTPDIHSFTHNKLVVIAPSQRNVSFDVNQANSWLAAIDDGRLAIGQPNAVPAGIYAKQSLESLKLWSPLRGFLAPTSSVRVALTLVERSEATLGIVYRSDALISNKVQVIHTFSDATHASIRYPLVQLTDSKNVAQFTQYLLSDSAKQVLANFGFEQ